MRNGHILNDLIEIKKKKSSDGLALREGKRSGMKPWFHPEQIKDVLPLTDKETTAGGVASRRKIEISVQGMLSLRCLLDVQDLWLKVGVRAGYLNLGVTHVNMAF